MEYLLRNEPTLSIPDDPIVFTVVTNPKPHEIIILGDR
jgi:hypothetical protein